MIKMLLPFFLVNTLNSFCQDKFQLAPPLLKYTSIFFDSQTTLEIKFNQPNAEVRYTINGNEPTEKDLLYSRPILITGQRVLVKARALGTDFIQSRVVSVEFFRKGKDIRQINFTPSNPKYPGSGPTTLHDNLGGQTSTSFSTWLGYDRDTVEVNIELKRKEKITSVLLDLLQNEGSWIFLPEKILLYYYDSKTKAFIPAGQEVYSSESPSPNKCSAQMIVPSQKIKTNRLKLILLPLKKIPGWHNGKDNHAWLFVDEIIIY